MDDHPQAADTDCLGIATHIYLPHGVLREEPDRLLQVLELTLDI